MLNLDALCAGATARVNHLILVRVAEAQRDIAAGFEEARHAADARNRKAYRDIEDLIYRLAPPATPFIGGTRMLELHAQMMRNMLDNVHVATPYAGGAGGIANQQMAAYSQGVQHAAADALLYGIGGLRMGWDEGSVTAQSIRNLNTWST